MKKWIIYKNHVREGQVNKMSDVFIFIEATEGRRLSGWDVRSDEVRQGEDWIAKREEIQ